MIETIDERLEAEYQAATLRIDNDLMVIAELTKERDTWRARCEFSFEQREKLTASRDAYAAAADSMAAEHKVERDALKEAARLALAVMDDLSGVGMSEVECLSVLRAIAALKAVL